MSEFSGRNYESCRKLCVQNITRITCWSFFSPRPRRYYLPTPYNLRQNLVYMVAVKPTMCQCGISQIIEIIASKTEKRLNFVELKVCDLW